MPTNWRPVQFRIFSSQLTWLLNNVETNLRYADPATEMYRGTVEFGVINATSAHQALFDRARALGYSIYPGRQLGGQLPDRTAAPQKYWEDSYWEDEAVLLESQIAMMGDDFRLTLDIEGYKDQQDHGIPELSWSNHFSADTKSSEITSQWGSLADLRKAMVPYLFLLSKHRVAVLIHPASLDLVLFTEIADAVGGRVCMQSYSTYGHELVIYRDDAKWKTARHTLASHRVAPLLRRYPDARISLGYHDTIIRKYWFNRLAQLSSVEHGHVFIDDQYKLDWRNQLGNQSVFDCTHPAYNMNEHVVEAYHFRGNSDHLSDSLMRGSSRPNVAVGRENRLELTNSNSKGNKHAGAAVLESKGSRYLIDSGPGVLGVGYRRALKTDIHKVAPFDHFPFTILLDFYLHDLSGLGDPFGQRNPLLSIWGATTVRWFRVFWRETDEYVFEVREKHPGKRGVKVSVPAGPRDSRRRRLQIAHRESVIRIWNDQGDTAEREFHFPVRQEGSLVLNYERVAEEGDFHYTRCVAYDQLVVWDDALRKIPTGKSYPFIESQI